MSLKLRYLACCYVYFGNAFHLVRKKCYTCIELVLWSICFTYIIFRSSLFTSRKTHRVSITKAVLKNARPLFWESCETHKYILWSKHGIYYVNIRTCGTKMNHWINFSIVYRWKKPITKMYSCNWLMFLQSMNYHLPYMIAAVSIFWPFVQTFSQHLSPELTNFLQHFPADSYLKYSCTKNTQVNSVPASRHTVTSKKNWYMHLLAINLMISNLLRLVMNKFAQVVSFLMVNSSIIALFPFFCHCESVNHCWY